MSRRKLRYGSQDWFSALHSEVRPSASVPVYANRLQNVDAYPQTVYPQAAPCPPGFRYRPKRKPGQRKCTKEKVKSVLSFLQMLATQNRISIFKVRKDKKGYTRTLLTIPQLKSRLTRNGISYRMNKSKFGMMIPEGELPPVATIEGMATGRERADRINDYKREMEYIRPRLEASAAEEGQRVYNEVWNMRPIGPNWTERQRLYQAEAHSKRASEWLLKNYYARSRELKMRNAIATINDRRLADSIYRRVGIEWDEAFASFMADKAAREAAIRRLREIESLDEETLSQQQRRTPRVFTII